MTKRVLVIANDMAGEQPLHDVIRGCAQDGDVDVLVLASEPGLEACLERLHAAGIPARGRVGRADPLRAVSDGLDGFAADEIVLATATPKWPFWPRRSPVDRIRGRFAGTIFHVVLDPVPKPRPILPTPLVPRLSERR